MTASATGVTSSASFSLTNQIQPSFSGLTGQTITYGSTVTFTGTLAAGSQVPAGEEVAVTVDGVTHDATIASDGSFSTQFTGADVVLNASSTAYNVTYDYATDGVFLAADGSSQLTVNPAEFTITAASRHQGLRRYHHSSKTPTYGTLYNGDTVTGLTQAFTSKNVLGTNGSTLMVTGYTVNDGDGGKDYTVTTQTATGTITPVPLTVRANERLDRLRLAAAGPDLYDRRVRWRGQFKRGERHARDRNDGRVGASAGAYPITIAAGTLSADQLQLPRRRPDRRHADRDARASRDHGRLDEHVHRPASAGAHGGLHRIRQRRHAGQSHARRRSSTRPPARQARRAATPSPSAAPAHPTTRSRTCRARSP